MNSRAVLGSIGIAVALALVGCGESDPTDGADAPAAASGTSTTDAPAAQGTQGPAESPAQAADEPPADEPAVAAAEHRVTYDWAAPSEQVTIEHSATAPTPYLVAIYTGDHPEGDPPHQRVAFYFREGFPEYNLQYAPAVEDEGTGEPIALDGNAFLRVGFVNAQAHDGAGKSTVSVAPANPIGFQNLTSIGSAGDFEGHLTYGLGLQVAPNSDQVLLVRAGELTRPDEASGTYYVVYVDVEAG